MAGVAGEKLAQEYLLKNKYKILATNYRTATGEIDIIAEQRTMLVFVEVKTRSSDLYGSPGEAVTLHKQRKITQTALWYLKQTGQWEARVRFDVMEVWLKDDIKNARLNHIINAFGES
ncbi:MAG: hypothetical protein H6Q74_2130 [Firmicutes bacterium]|nr:hypothetical protein [Bacillota bacterium]